MARSRPSAPAPTTVVTPEVVQELVTPGPVDPAMPPDLGRRLRAVRRRQRLSRAEVARSAGLTRREVAAYERGATVPATDLWCIAGSCGVDVAELLPTRDPLRVDADTLSIGDTVRRLRDGSTTDEVLTEYAGMVRELRDLGPDDTAEVREADLAALAESLRATPEEIQDRLGNLLGPPPATETPVAEAPSVGDPHAIERFLTEIPADGPVLVDGGFAFLDEDSLAALRHPLAAPPAGEPVAEPVAEPVVSMLEPAAMPEPEPVVVTLEPAEPEPEPTIAWRADSDRTDRTAGCTITVEVDPATGHVVVRVDGVTTVTT